MAGLDLGDVPDPLESSTQVGRNQREWQVEAALELKRD